MVLPRTGQLAGWIQAINAISHLADLLGLKAEYNQFRTQAEQQFLTAAPSLAYHPVPLPAGATRTALQAVADVPSAVSSFSAAPDSVPFTLAYNQTVSVHWDLHAHAITVPLPGSSIGADAYIVGNPAAGAAPGESSGIVFHQTANAGAFTPKVNTGSTTLQLNAGEYRAVVLAAGFSTAKVTVNYHTATAPAAGGKRYLPFILGGLALLVGGYLLYERDPKLFRG